jgi:kynurenine formamidase
VADLEGIVFRVPSDGGRAIGPRLFGDLDLQGKAVLVQTGWDRHWRTEQYLSGHPFLTGEAARLLLDRGAALVGIDSLNIDDTQDGGRPVHSALLGAEVPIVEHMCNLAALPATGFRFSAVPAKVARFGTWPVRAYGHVLSAN